MSLLLLIHHHVHLELLVGFVLLLRFYYEPVKMAKCHKVNIYLTLLRSKVNTNSITLA